MGKGIGTVDLTDSFLVDSLSVIEMPHVADSLRAIHINQSSIVTNTKLEDLCSFVVLQKSKWFVLEQT